MGTFVSRGVLAAVVTFNRLNLLKRCLEHLKRQVNISDIIVINNSSTDGTEEYLKEAGIPFVTQENLGSSGGWNRAITEGLARGYDFIWLMDDDGFPSKDALKLLLERMTEKCVCLSSVVVNENDGSKFVFGMPRLNKKGNPVIFKFKRKHQRVTDIYPAMTTYPFTHLFNGALISLEKVRHIGNVDTRYFMYGDELDYFYRMREIGDVLSVLAARHNHPDVSKRIIEKKRVYYYIRNTIILNNKYSDNSQIRNILTMGVALFRIMRRNGVLNCMTYILGRNAKYFYNAVKDGYCKNFSKRF